MDLFEHFQAVTSGNIYIEEEDVPFLRGCFVQGVLRGGGFAKSGAWKRVAENLFQTTPYHLVVINYQNVHLAPFSSPASGIRTRTTVPSPGGCSKVTVPPSNIALSCIPTKHVAGPPKEELAAVVDDDVLATFFDDDYAKASGGYSYAYGGKTHTKVMKSSTGEGAMLVTYFDDDYSGVNVSMNPSDASVSAIRWES